MDKTGTKSTQNHKNHKNPHISEALNPDAILRKLSIELFDLDDVSRSILTVLGRRGPQTEYELSRWITISNRRSIGRRINNPNGLLKKGFLYESIGKKLRTPRMERPFVLTFKGFIASLAKTNFEENSLIKSYKHYVEKESDPKFAEFVINYAKFNLAVILSWHKINGFTLTDLNYVMVYLSDFNYQQLYNSFPIELAYVNDSKHINEFVALRQFFLSLQIAMARLLQSREQKYSFTPYTIFKTNRKLQLYYSKEFLYSVIKGWMHCLEFPEYLDPTTVPPRTKLDQIKVIDVDHANDLSDKILDSIFNFKNTKKLPIPII